MAHDEEYIDLHGECAHEIARLKADNQKLAAQNSEMRRTFGSHPLFAEKDAEIGRLLTAIDAMLDALNDHDDLAVRRIGNVALGMADTAKNLETP